MFHSLVEPTKRTRQRRNKAELAVVSTHCRTRIKSPKPDRRSLLICMHVSAGLGKSVRVRAGGGGPAIKSLCPNTIGDLRVNRPKAESAVVNTHKWPSLRKSHKADTSSLLSAGRKKAVRVHALRECHLLRAIFESHAALQAWPLGGATTATPRAVHGRDVLRRICVQPPDRGALMCVLRA